LLPAATRAPGAHAYPVAKPGAEWNQRRRSRLAKPRRAVLEALTRKEGTHHPAPGIWGASFPFDPPSCGGPLSSICRNGDLGRSEYAASVERPQAKNESGEPCAKAARNVNKGLKHMSDVGERVKKIVVEHLGVEPEKVVDKASFIDDLGADSLDIVELVMAFEEEFGIEIPDDTAETILTVGDAVKFLEGAKAS